MSTKIIYSILGLILLSVGGYWVWETYTAPNPVESNKELYSDLMSEQDFGKAESFRNASDPRQALLAYKDALPKTRTHEEEGQIKLLIAISTEQSGEYMAAIPLYKEVAANTVYPERIRANAVQYMGLMQSFYGDPKITEEIFKDAPYTSLKAIHDPVSYRHLFEYASSLYPLALSELRIADWYATAVLIQGGVLPNTKKTITDEELVSYKLQATTHLANADKEIDRMRGDPLDDSNLPLALMRKAIALGKMERAKVFTNVAEQAFGIAQKEYEDRGWTSGFLYYNFALYLNQTSGAKRTDLIVRTLSGIYAGQRDEYAISFLTNERTNVTGSKADIVSLAKVDPKFKDFLISLGWKTTDLK